MQEHYRKYLSPTCIANSNGSQETDPQLHTSESQKTSTQGHDDHTNLLDPKLTRAESELRKLLRSQHKDPDVEMKYTPKRYLLKFKGSDLSFCEMPPLLQESLEFSRMDALINRECFIQVGYYR